jgi:hypothetical protein
VEDSPTRGDVVPEGGHSVCLARAQAAQERIGHCQGGEGPAAAREAVLAE